MPIRPPRFVRLTTRKVPYFYRRLTRRDLPKRLDFMIVGAARSGTTTLDAYMRDHPQICMAAHKEVHFFDHDKHFHGKPNYRTYHANFAPKPVHKVIGEATPSYMFWKTAPERMHAYNSGLKLIMILRNPIDRAYSHWNLLRRQGLERLSFWEALQAEPERQRRAAPLQYHNAQIDGGRYVEQIERIWRYFPADQLLVLRFEDLQRSPKETLDQVYDYIGVDRQPFVREQVANVGAYQAPMGDRERAYLTEIYEPEITALEALLGWDCSDWLSKAPAALRLESDATSA